MVVLRPRVFVEQNPLVLLWFSILPVYSLPLTLLKNVFAFLGLSFTFSFFLILLRYCIASVGKRYDMLERRKSVCYFLGNFLLVFLILASSFNYPLVAQVLGGIS